jgi:hypothetical protein
VVSVTHPYGCILGFLDRSRDAFLSSSSSVVLTRLSRPRSRPTNFFSGSAGNRTLVSGSGSDMHEIIFYKIGVG